MNSAGKEDKNHTYVYRLQDLKNHPDVKLTRGGMILIGLMSGGDYHSAGVPRCGKVTAHGLAKCGFGDSLYDAAVNLDREDLAEFIRHWREDLRQELRTNSQGHIGRKQVALANTFPLNFPDIDILLSYVKPITSESMGRESNNTKLTWSKEPDLGKLAATCEFYFEWGYKEAIIKRFRTIMWHSIVLRILRRAVLDLDSKRSGQVPSTPRKQKEGIPCGTPSKMITQHFSALGLATPTRTYLSGSESEDEDEERLILKIHGTRTHTSTNGLLEYRLEIAPKQLVRLAEAGIKGTRVPEGPDEWASENDDDDDDEPKKKNKAPVDPETHLRLWMPACMVKLVEPDLVKEHEEKEDQKLQKKLKKGTRKTATTNKATEKPRTKKSEKKAVATAVDIIDDVFSSPIPPPKPLKNSQPLVQRKFPLDLEPSTDPEVSSDPDLPASLRIRAQASKPPDVLELSSDEEPSKSTRTSLSRGINVLPVSKVSKKPTNSTSGLKDFFPVTKPSNKLNSKPSTTEVSKTEKRISSNSGINRSSGQPVAGPSGLGKSKPRIQPTRYESDDSIGEYDPAIWANVNAPGFSISSPSKRKNKSKAPDTSSESESSRRLKKSPRKKITHTSPQITRRPVSPSPARLRPPVLRKICDEVIDIHTDSEDDDPPTAIFPLSKAQKSLPPCPTVRPIMNSTLVTRTSSNKSSLKKPPSRPIIISEVIDLT